ncbi:MAG: TetR/AcrR family transcriptional regulator [Geosporobacter ferrireducens]|nr:TetR/AcrR family transcriptional regulator [Geosporobacter ferrireducens]
MYTENPRFYRGFSEFVEKGYDKASTDRIIQRAEISKSLLFYYFKNKKGLFLYLVGIQGIC